MGLIQPSRGRAVCTTDTQFAPKFPSSRIVRDYTLLRCPVSQPIHRSPMSHPSCLCLPSSAFHIGCNSHPCHVCHGDCWHYGPLIFPPGVWKSLLPSSWSPGWITAWLESKGLAWDTDLQENIKKMTRVIAAPWSPPHNLRFTSPHVGERDTLGEIPWLSTSRVDPFR